MGVRGLVLALASAAAWTWAAPPFDAFEPQSRWVQTPRRLSPDTNVTWWIGVRAAAPDALGHAFANITTPTHTQFMQYLTKLQTDALTAPSADALRALSAWLHPMATTYSDATNVMVVHSSVEQLEAATGASMAEFVAGAAPRIVRASTPLAGIPASVQPYITCMSVNLAPSTTATYDFAASESSSSSPRRLKHAKGKHPRATPAFLRQLYGIPPPEELHVTHAHITQSVASFYNEAFSRDDLATFRDQLLGDWPVYGDVAARGTFEMTGEMPAHSEPSLDVQYITALAPNATTTVWAMASHNPFSAVDEPFVAWAQDVLEAEEPPLVHSISYSDNERRLAATAPQYIATLDALLQKMAVRGLTILVSSGDDGVMGLGLRQDNLTIDDACATSSPQWPSSSPFVTSVGATMVLPDDPTQTEVVCMASRGGRITSGGGFSSIYAAPAYQRSAVAAYLSTAVLPPRPFFDAGGRGYPDVAAYGTHFRVRVDGSWRSISGTSASAPVVAGMATLWNELRAREGKPPVGFLNPALYQLHALGLGAFHDVAAGDNRDGKVQNHSVPTCPHGFSAAPGWDPATGLGTPNFAVIAPLMVDIEDILRSSNASVWQPTGMKPAPMVQLKTPRHWVPEATLEGLAVFASTLVGVVALGYAVMMAWVAWRRRPALYQAVDAHDTWWQDEQPQPTSNQD